MKFDNCTCVNPRSITIATKCFHLSFSFALGRKINNIIVLTKSAVSTTRDPYNCIVVVFITPFDIVMTVKKAAGRDIKNTGRKKNVQKSDKLVKEKHRSYLFCLISLSEIRLQAEEKKTLLTYSQFNLLSSCLFKPESN